MLRIKRNTLVVSVTVLFYQLSVARIEEINLLGTSLNVSNPINIDILLLFITLYHFIYLFWNSIIVMKKNNLEAVLDRHLTAENLYNINDKTYLMQAVSTFLDKSKEEILKIDTIHFKMWMIVEVILPLGLAFTAMILIGIDLYNHA